MNATSPLVEDDTDAAPESASDTAPGTEAAEKASAGSEKTGGAVIVKPVVNAVRILRYLTQSGAPERAVDIARNLKINSSTCFNILRTLVAEDVVDFNALSKTYSAGLGLAKLVEQLVTQGQRIQHALPLMRELASRFGATMTLWRRLGNDRIVLMNSESSPTDMHIDMPAGQRVPIYMGASGRVFVGRMGLDEAQLREEFSHIRWARPLSFETYWREVQKARRRGFAVDDGYFATGVLTIAAPVNDPSGNIVFTVSAVMIRGQRSDVEIDNIGVALHDLGLQLSSVLF